MNDKCEQAELIIFSKSVFNNIKINHYGALRDCEIEAVAITLFAGL